ncbi:30994_t:CDS:2 [Gigaspora margarita]|uniref:30994_t:CDS:1 n=1 Tax=Gigaspora margarita TaxID=4874 RepID=A0ABM8W0T4_GIGMA|nr:30994_t:CDS:2 [Gigaspora margarita]
MATLKESQFIPISKINQIEFKSKGINFLDLKVDGNNKSQKILEKKAKKVKVMSIDETTTEVEGPRREGKESSSNEVHHLKCSNFKQHDKKDNYYTLAFVVMSVESRRIVWKKAT